MSMGGILYLADRHSPSFRAGRLTVDAVCAGDSITGWNNFGEVECWPYRTYPEFLQRRCEPWGLVVADCGIAGGLIALWFIVLVFRRVGRGIRSRDSLLAGLALGCGTGVFAMLVHSVFDFNLQVPSNALLFLLLSAVVTQIGAAVRDKKEGSPLKSLSRELQPETERVSSFSVGRGL